MKFLIKNLFLTLSFATLLLSGCVKQEFDVPPVDGEEPNIVANTSIADLKAMHNFGEFEKITEDLVIRGIVVADDRSGNFFRSFILQDESAGIEVAINLADAYNLYPIGRELFIKCQGLYLADDEGVIQLGEYTYFESGSTNLGNIINLNKHIIKGKRQQPLEPTVRAINQLGTDDISTLIKIEGVEFAPIDKNQTYADPVGRRSLNRTVQDCNGNFITLRSSGYADFAGELTPELGGTIVGIYSVFGTTAQLFIRNLDDVQMNNADFCTTGGGGNSGGDPITIKEIRDLFSGTETNAPSGRSITGIVTSDRANGNIHSQNLTMQDETAGIVVRFTSDHDFDLGDEIEVNVSNVEISEFSGLLQLNNVNLGNASRLSSGKEATPTTLTIDDIVDDLETYESMLVAIDNVTISGGSTFSSNLSLNDGTGTIAMFTRNSASFANATPPTEPTNMLVVVSQFDTPQVFIRNLDDVPGADTGGSGGGGGNPDALINETFDDETSGADVAIDGWTNYNVAGNLKWQVGDFDGNNFADINPFNTGENNIEAWLITPEVDLSEAHTLSFQSSQHHWVHDGLSVWVSEDYEEGDNPEDATWEELEVPLAQESDEWYAWINSGEVDLSDYNGTVYVGFKFVGDANANTTGIRLDNITVE